MLFKTETSLKKGTFFDTHIYVSLTKKGTNMKKDKEFKREIYGRTDWINGRINRAEYFGRTLTYSLLGGLAIVLGTMLYFRAIFQENDIMLIGACLFGLFYIWMSWRLMTTYVKRLHDLGWGGWLSIFIICYSFSGLLGFSEKASNFVIDNENFFLILEVIAGILSLILLFKKGTTGINKYGKDPLTKYEENK